MAELKWLKSTYSDAGGNNCVEVAATGDGIALRESAAPAQVMTVGQDAFRALLAGGKAGSYDAEH
ncbi:DUF397 domain-containing protein [Streptomyces sp. NPDC059788]|uniref:DUF397 domain-containing protein n=1 Tax=Streptomyces sp. NPDC059788 TaxID=3346948 RepID=UPI00365D0173